MIYDITKELFTTEVYPGDPVPKIERVSSLDQDVCQLSEITIGSHSGTHLDAPAHFCVGGKDVSEIPLEKCAGKCRIISHNGTVRKEQIDQWTMDGMDKILIHGDVVIHADSAEYMAEKKINCLGVEMGTVAYGDDQIPVHKILLGAEIVIIEGLTLEQVPDGIYFLSAAPLKMQGSDGSPVRAFVYTL
ncbi:MAG: cyclase family protein [Ruminococcus sp.]|nr:cyclase family protein [Ruminococcus sp.]